MKDFYESGYVPAKEVAESKLLKTVKLLKGRGDKRIGVAIGRSELIKDFIDELSSFGIPFTYFRTRAVVELEEGVKVYFFVHHNDRDIHHLYGMSLESAIIWGQPSKEFTSLLGSRISVGKYPILVVI